MAPHTSLSYCLSLLPDLLPCHVHALAQDLPKDLIEQALQATGHATIRRRHLPAEHQARSRLGKHPGRYTSLT